MNSPAHTIQTLVLDALGEITQTEVARRAGVSDATITRFKGEHLELAAKVLAACGFDLVRTGERRYDPAYIQSLTTLARLALDRELGA